MSGTPQETRGILELQARQGEAARALGELRAVACNVAAKSHLMSRSVDILEGCADTWFIHTEREQSSVEREYRAHHEDLEDACVRVAEVLQQHVGNLAAQAAATIRKQDATINRCGAQTDSLRNEVAMQRRELREQRERHCEAIELAEEKIAMLTSQVGYLILA